MPDSGLKEKIFLIFISAIAGASLSIAGGFFYMGEFKNHIDNLEKQVDKLQKKPSIVYYPADPRKIKCVELADQFTDDDADDEDRAHTRDSMRELSCAVLK